MLTFFPFREQLIEKSWRHTFLQTLDISVAIDGSQVSRLLTLRVFVVRAVRQMTLPTTINTATRLNHRGVRSLPQLEILDST